MSPKKSIFCISLLYFFASSIEFICSTVPFCSFTIGPSIVSQGVIVVAFPGLSVFSCVPVAMYLFSMCIVAGCMLWQEYPLILFLPYLNLNPPSLRGYPNTGLPATRSVMYV